jgi:uncharacterized protein YdhG (YjbR/CyaY superfamily)
MQSTAATVAEYYASLPVERAEAIAKIAKLIKKNIKGLEECMYYGSVGFVVPKKIFPAGYHCDPKLPLGFINIASQKNFIALYHMGIYGDANLLEWFTTNYPKHSTKKLDMGKSCIRFKKVEDIPYALLEELFQKMDMQQWINCYTTALTKTKK